MVSMDKLEILDLERFQAHQHYKHNQPYYPESGKPITTHIYDIRSGRNCFSCIPIDHHISHSHYLAFLLLNTSKYQSYLSKALEIAHDYVSKQMPTISELRFAEINHWGITTENNTWKCKGYVIDCIRNNYAFQISQLLLSFTIEERIYNEKHIIRVVMRAFGNEYLSMHNEKTQVQSLELKPATILNYITPNFHPNMTKNTPFVKQMMSRIPSEHPLFKKLSWFLKSDCITISKRTKSWNVNRYCQTAALYDIEYNRHQMTFFYNTQSHLYDGVVIIFNCTEKTIMMDFVVDFMAFNARDTIYISGNAKHCFEMLYKSQNILVPWISDYYQRKRERKTVEKKCLQCKKFDIKLKICAGCQMAYYCSKKCQKLSWQSHKNYCFCDLSFFGYFKVVREQKYALL
eukprot:501557_1